MPTTPNSDKVASQGSEHAHQVALFIWASQNLKQYPELELLFAIPNGGERNFKVAAQLKAEGVKPGVPDLCLPIPKSGYFGLFIELKRPEIVGKQKAGKPSDEQLKYIAKLNECGYIACVCVGWEQARDTLLQYLNLS